MKNYTPASSLRVATCLLSFVQKIKTPKAILLNFTYSVLILFSTGPMLGQTCDCTDYLYVNDPSEDLTHKFALNANGSVGTEIGSPWLPTGSIINPHGVVSDVNGNLYISQIQNGGTFVPTQLFKLSCDGTILDSDFIPNWNRTLNMVTIDNVIYSIGRDPAGSTYHIYTHDICNPAAIDSLELPGGGTAGWALTQGEDDKLYFTQSFGSNTTHDFELYEVANDLSSYTLIKSITNIAGYTTHGVDQDEFGNFYLVTTNNSTGATTIYKIDSSGTIIHTITDNNLDQAGFAGAWGIVYNQPSGKIYVGTLGDDCVAVIDAGGSTGNMVYQSALGVGHVPGTYSKALYIVTECCPSAMTTTVDTTLCVGSEFQLRDILGCNDGILCEGTWTPDVGNIGLSYDPCDQTVTIDSDQACGTFTRASSGSGNQQCGAFSITMNISVDIITNNTIGSAQSICLGDAANTLTSNASANGTILYQWQESSTDCNGTFTDISMATSSTYDPGSPTSTTYYRLVSSINGSCSTGTCIDTSNCIAITVNPLPNITLNDPADVCIDGSDMNFTATPTGGTFTTTAPAGFSSNGAAGAATLDVSAAGAGTYAITYNYTDGNGCSNSSTSSVTVFALPVLSLNDPSDECIDGSDMTFTATPVNGSFSSDASSGFTFNNAAGTATLDVSAAGAGNFEVTYDYTDANGCTNSETVSVSVFALPVVTLNDPADECINGSDMAFTATPTGGSFSSDAPSGFTFNNAAGTANLDVTAAGAGNYNVTYNYTDANGCVNSTNVSVTVFPLPVVTLNDPTDQCIDGSDMNFTATPAGGSFSSDASSGFTFNNAAGTAILDVSAAGAGMYNITYNYTDANGCTNSQTVNVEVFALPAINLNDPADQCENAFDMNFSVSTTGGTWTSDAGSGFTSNSGNGTAMLDVSTAGPGTYDITYSVTSAQGCYSEETVEVTVFIEPNVNLTDPGDQCVDGMNLTFIGTPTPFGATTGTFSSNAGMSLTDNGNGTATLNVSGAGPGVYTVNYTFTNGNNCANSAIQSVEIFALPTVSITDPGNTCTNDSDLTFVGTPAPAMGISGNFTSDAGAALMDNGDGTATLDVSASGAGTFNIAYTYTDGNGCVDSDATSVQVFNIPVVTLSNPGNQCVDGADLNFTGSPTPAMGTTGIYTSNAGAALTDNGNGTATLDVSVAGAGVFDITYTYTDGNGCDVFQTESVEVFALPSITINDPNDTCINDSDLSFSGTPIPSMGISGVFTTNAPAGFTDNSDGTASLDVSAAGPGTFNFTYTYTDNNGCVNSQSTSVELFDLPIVSLTNPGDQCIDGADLTFTGSPAPVMGTTGVYSSNAGAALADNGDGTSTLDVSAAGAGVYNITYTYTDGNGCEVFTTENIEVFALPSTTLNDPADRCLSDTDFAFTASPSGGSFMSTAPGGFNQTSSNTATLDPALAGPGTYNVTYSYIDANGCSDMTTVSVTVFPFDPIDLNDPADQCENAADMNFAVTTTGGTWTSDAPSGFTSNSGAGTATLDVSAAGPGTYMVSYSVTSANGCTSTESVSVTVFIEPNVNITDPGDACIDGSDLDFIGTPTPFGATTGTFTSDAGSSLTDNGNGTATLDVSNAGPGVYTITYTFTNANNCVNTASQSVEVFALPTVTINDPADTCINEADLIYTATPPPAMGISGVFTSTAGISLTDNSDGTASLDVSNAGPGTYTVTYTYTDNNGCVSSQNSSVELFDTPVVTLNDPSDMCIDGVDMFFMASPANGTFMSTATTGFVPDNANGTAVLDLSVAGVGTYDVSYSFTNANGCTESQIVSVEIFDLPTIALSNPGDRCIDGADMFFTASPLNGTFMSSASAGFSGNGATGMASLDVSLAGIGSHTITYTYTDANGCTNSETETVNIYDLPSVSINDPSDQCVDGTDMAFTGSPLPMAGSTGVFSTTAAGLTDNTDGTANIDVSVAGPGTYDITYTYTDANGCSNSSTSSVTIFALPMVSVNGGPFCVDDTPSNLTGNPSGGTFSGTGITDANAGTFNPVTAGVGMHTITYNYTDANGCSNSNTTDVVVNALPVVSVSGGPFCVDDTPSNLTGNPSGGTFSGTGITDANAGTFNPATAGVGMHTITYNYTDANGCSNSNTTDVVVNALPVVSVSGGPFCVDDTPSNLTGNPSGGTFSGTGITDANAGTFNPATAGVGMHTITYNYTDANGCSNSNTTDVVVNTLPVVSVSGGPFCVDDTPSNLTGNPSGGTFSGTGITDANAGTFNPATAGVGMHTITYNFTDANGCSNSNTTDVVVNALPVVAVSGGPFCVDETPSNLTGNPSGGTFSGTGITDANAGTFNPATAGVGMHTITYNYTDANGCSNSNTTDVVVNALPVVTVSGGPFCVDDTPSNLTGNPSGGTFSGTGITDANAGTFNPATAGVGMHTITYNFTDANGCSNSNTTDVVVNALPIVNLTPSTLQSCTTESDITFSATPINGTFTTSATAGFTSDGSTGMATLDVSAAGSGNYSVTYDYTDANGCANSETVNVIVCAFDLALTKILSGTPAGPYTQNSPATYEITIYNQGTLDAFDIDVNEYFNNAELNFVDLTIPMTSTNGNALSVIGSGPNFEIEELAAGDNVTIDVNFTIDDMFMGMIIVNNAEIVDASETDNGPTAVDEDSPLTTTNDGSTNELGTDNDIADDSNGETDNPLDEDDYDPATIMIGQTFDLALIKQFSSASDDPIIPGSSVTFDIQVFNQGSLSAFEIQLSDYVPNGLTLMDNDWEMVGDTARLKDPIYDIEASMDTTVKITFVVDPTFMEESITNNAEIESALDFTGNPGDDMDSPYGNEDGSVPDSPDDDVDDTLGGDDYDPATIDIYQSFDLALLDTLNTTGTIVPGQTIEFSITVYNQGTVTANNLVIEDFIPSGTTLVTGGDFTEIATDSIVATIASLAPGSSQELIIQVVIDAEYMGTLLTNNAEITEATNTLMIPDEDTPLTNQIGAIDDTSEVVYNDDISDDSNGGSDNPLDQDDYDPAQATVTQTYDLAIDKNILTMGPFAQDSMITYEIIVTNEGTLDGSNIEVTDFPDIGLNYVSSNAGMIANVTETSTGIWNIISLPINSSETVQVTYQIDSDFQGTTLNNRAEITADNGTDIDSDPDSNNITDDLGDMIADDDEDEVPITVNQVYDLAIDKNLLTAGPFAQDSTVTFEIIVTNEGSLNAASVILADNPQNGLNYVSSNAGTIANVTETSPGFWNVASLPHGTSETIQVTYQIASNFQGTTLDNGAQITDDNGDDIDSDPADDYDTDDLGDMTPDDDEDVVVLMIEQIYDLAIAKDLITAGPFAQDSLATFSIVVTNEGSLDAANVQLTDTPQTGLNYVSSNAGMIANVTETSPGIWTVADLDQNASQTIEVTYQIDSDFQGTTLLNEVEITADDGTDIDSDPDSDNTADDLGDMLADDDEDDALVPVEQIYDLALDKNLLTAGPFAQDSFATYQILVTNEGSLDAANVEVTDIPQTGLNYVSSNAGSIANVTETSPGVWNVIALNHGVTEIIEVTYQVDMNFMGTSLTNKAQITSDNGNDVDSDPDTDDTVDDLMDMLPDDDEDEVTLNIGQTFDLAIDKNLLTAGPFAQDSLITYEVIVTNEGTLIANNTEVTDIPQTGLNYISSNAGSIPNVTETSSGVWTVATLNPNMDQVIEVTYQVDASFQGTSLTNKAQITADDNDDVDSDPDDDDTVDDLMDMMPDDDEDEVVVTIDQIYDLAIDKNLLTAGPFAQDSLVTYEIIVTNEGSLDAASILFVDNPQTGLNYVSSNAGMIANVTETSPGFWNITSLPQGADETIQVTYQIASDFQGTSLNNGAQITDDNGDDIDSDPADDYATDDLTDMIADDDEDEVLITVDQIYDLAIAKDLLSAGPFAQDSLVTFSIEVTNEGSLDAANVQLTDTPQTGLNYVSSNAGMIANVTETSPGIWTVADLDQNASQTIEVTYQIDSDFQGFTLLNEVEITADDGTDIDSDPDTDNTADDLGDMLADDDEDDALVPVEQIYDLALDKNLLTAGPFAQDSFATYQILVTNEGSLDAANIVVADIPQTGLNYISSNAGMNANVTETSPGIWNVIALDHGVTETIEVTYQIDMNFMGTSLTNKAQITSDNGNDVDSDPDTDDTVDDLMDMLPDDDEDEVTLNIGQTFDLAIDKNLLTAGPFAQDSLITYEIIVTNEGTLIANNTEVTDIPQTGLNYISSNAGSIPNVTETSSGVWTVATLNPNMDQVIEVTYQVDASFQGTSLTNKAQITADDNDDVDSDPDDDDTVDDLMDMMPDDDEDEVVVTIEQIYDLAIDKSTLTPGPYAQDSLVTYTIVVTNEGSLDAVSTLIVDNPQAGLTYVSSNAMSIPNVTETSPGFWTVGNLPSGFMQSLQVTYQIDADFQGTTLTNKTQITDDNGDDVDSDPTSDYDTDDLGDMTPDDDEDEVLLMIEQIYDLAIAKDLLTAGPFAQDSLVTFSIVVTNEGSLDAANVQLTDTPQTGLNYVSSNAGSIANVTETSPGIWTVADLDQNASQTIEVTYQIDSDFQGTTLLNEVEITADDGTDIDSDPDTDNTADDLGDMLADDDEDDALVPVEQIYDLALDKNLITMGPFEQDSFATYQILVTNEGSLDAANIIVADNPQTGLNYISSNAGMNANVTETSPGVWNVITLDHGVTEIIEVTYQVDMNFMGTSLTNKAQITSDNGNDVDSDPDDDDTVDDLMDMMPDDDEDEVTLMIGQTFDLAIDKNLLTAGPFAQDSLITYEIIVTNEGSLNANNTVVTDIPQTGLNYISSNAGMLANVNETSSGVWTVITLVPNTNETIQVTYQVDASFQGTSLTNKAQITADDNDDVDSDPDDDDTVDDLMDMIPDDDEDEVVVTIDQIYDLAIDKNILTAGPFAQDSLVTYEIIVTNEGSLDAANVLFVDNPQTGLNYVSSNAGMIANVTETSPGFWNITSLPQGADETIQVTYQIASDFQGTSLNNGAQITDDNGDDIDSDPADDYATDDLTDMIADDDEDEVLITVDQIYDLAIVKDLLTAGPFAQDSLVTFSIVVTNEGSLDAANVQLTDTPQTGLNYVSSNAGSIANVTETSPGIWTVADLDQNASQTIEVTYQIDSDFQGTTLLNEVEITADDGTDIDSDPDTDNTTDDLGDMLADDDEDDALVPVEQIYDLALDKNLLTAGPFAQDSFATYQILVTNEGSLDAANIVVADIPQTGLNYISSNAGMNANVTETSPGIWNVIALDHGVTETIEVTYQIDMNFMGTSLTNKAQITSDNGNDVDSDPDDDDTVDDLMDMLPDDDEDEVTLNIGQTFDLAIDKNLLTAGPFAQDSLITYEIIVTNEGTLIASNTEVTDIPQTGLNYISSNAGSIPNVTETSSGVWTVAALNPNMDQVIQVAYQVDASFQGTSLTNKAQITADDNDDVDSDPDDDDTVDDLMDMMPDDDEDEVVVTIDQIYDLAIDKNLLTAGPFAQDSLVTYEIIVTNEGSLDAASVLFVDNPQTGLNYVSSNAGMIANVTETSPGFWNITSLPQGADETIQVTYQIASDFQGTSLNNGAQITDDNGDDIDSDPADDYATDDLTDLIADDDEDEVLITVDQIYDLAIAKDLVTAGPFAQDSLVTFSIMVTNEGSLDAANVQLTDTPQTGLNYVSSNAGSIANVTETSPGIWTVADLDQNTSQTIEVTYQIDSDFQGSTLLNEVEITADDGTDIDSDPDTDNTADDLGDMLADDDEDDALVPVEQIYDLAIDKTVTSMGPYMQSSTVTYSIEVTNEGSLDAAGIIFEDIPATGLNYQGSNAGSIANVTENVPGNWTIANLPANASQVISVTYQVDPDFEGTTLDNDVQITNDDGDDTDSDPDDDNTVDDLMDMMPDDDEDTETIDVDQIFDLALLDTLVTTGIIRPGNTVEFSITVINQGTITATDVWVEDFLPSETTLVTGGSFSENMTGQVLASIPSIGPGEEVELILQVIVDPTFQGSVITNNAEIIDATNDLLLMDEDTPLSNLIGTIDDTSELATDNDIDDDSTGGMDNGSDQDDYDPAQAMVDRFDLALTKTFASASSNPILPGSTVTFDILVRNQGTIDAYDVQVNDYVPTGLLLMDSNWSMDVDTAKLQTPIPFIGAGLDQTVSITFMIDPNFAETSIVNNAEINSAFMLGGILAFDDDSTPGSEDGSTSDPDDNDFGNTFGNDDYDPAAIEIEPFASIGNFVWVDTNADGVQDPGEIGLEDVVVELLDLAGMVVARDTTDAAGAYLFEGLIPGDYKVSFILDEILTDPWNLSPMSQSPNDAIDSDANLMGMTTYTTLSPAEIDTTWDAGVFLYASLGDTVWYDANQNGIQDQLDNGDDEYPVQDIVVTLFDENDMPIAMTTTDLTGYYVFHDLIPGIYYVGLTPVDSLSVTIANVGDDSTDNDVDPNTLLSDPTTLMSGDFDNTIDIGLLINPTAEITDPCVCFAKEYAPTETFKFQDFISVQGTPGSVWTIQSHVGMLEVNATDEIPLAFGTVLNDLGNGWYTLDFLHLNGTGYTVTVTDGYEVLTFGNVCDAMFLDMTPVDPDVCIYDPEFALQASATYQGIPIPGQYQFFERVNNGPSSPISIFVPSSYNVGDEVEILGEFIPDDPSICPRTNLFTTILVGDCYASVGDVVWKDLDADGIQDNSEPGVPGILVTLRDCDDNVIDIEITGQDGSYIFEDLIPGDYYITFSLPQLLGCDFTTANVGGDDSLDSDVELDGVTPCFTLMPDQYDDTWDAGLLQLASLGDFVWHDLDGDGVRDGNEPPIPGVIVTLFTDTGVEVATAITDNNGEYLFDNLYPGSYYVQFDNPDPDYQVTYPNAGFNDLIDSDIDDSNGPGTTAITVLDPGENDLDWDAGYFKCIPIGERVWYDIQENDVWDVFENGINGLNVRLMKFENGSWTEWDNTYTGHKPGTPSDDGYFKFCAPPGIYHVAIDLPQFGLVPVRPNEGNNDDIDSDINNANGYQTTSTFTVVSGQKICNIGAGYYPMAQLGNKVWNDIDGNGLQSASEPVVQNVLVEAYDIHGVKVGEDMTNLSGEYNIDYLGKEDYFLKFSPPAGYTMTVANAGDDNMDSDVDNSNGTNTTAFISLNPGDTIMSVDAGIVLGVVPVEWLSFTAVHEGTHNALDWKTATEQNTSHFVIERQLESETSFAAIGQVDASGNSTETKSYDWDDKDISFKGNYYYRLKQIDNNGSFSYSEVRIVRIEDDRLPTASLYPNPAVDVVEFVFFTPQSGDVSVDVWDVDGRLVRENILQEALNAGTHTRQLDVESLTSGVYTLRLQVGKLIVNKKLIVVK